LGDKLFNVERARIMPRNWAWSLGMRLLHAQTLRRAVTPMRPATPEVWI
jgi:hypothetical protein